MAMTKAEKAEMQALRVALALRWPDYPAPVPMTVAEIRTSLTEECKDMGRTKMTASGWDFNSHAKRVERVWSDGLYHAYGGESWRQTPGRLYRTQTDALCAMRLEMSRRYAEDLADIDERVATSRAALSKAGVS